MRLLPTGKSVGGDNDYVALHSEMSEQQKSNARIIISNGYKYCVLFHGECANYFMRIVFVSVKSVLQRKMKKNPFTVSKFAMMVFIFLVNENACAIEFNTEVLDAVDRKNIDLSRFSQKKYIMPGQYQMQVVVNEQNISPADFIVSFIEPAAEKKGKVLPQACLTAQIVDRMGLTTSSRDKVVWWHNAECADLSQLPGVEIRPDPAEGILYINMPQAWLEYSDASWLPPSRWDNGIAGLFFDYNINARVNQRYKSRPSRAISYNGTTGANLGAWRLRADYHGSVDHATITTGENSRQFSWNRWYIYRAIPHWRAKLTLGEDYINSDIFNTWRYVGVSLISDDRMLPPKLRGYAPQISGIADSNARVVISRQGRILYDSTVPAGPFTIQDLDSAVRGRLDVAVIEQNGQKKTFQVDTAYVPYLTRPGQIRYKLVSGRARVRERSGQGTDFAGGEMSWGVSNQFSLYGGGVVAGNYNTLALGVGRDLLRFGALSADVTQSVAKFARHGTRQGKSWRLSYSKRFTGSDTDITFAGYRFSERHYMTMQQYLDARYRNDFSGREKEMYSLTLNKNLAQWQASVSLQYSYQTFWDRGASDYYMLSVNRYFDAFGFRNIAASLTASRSNYLDQDNDAVFLRFSLPWGAGSASYSSSMSNKRFAHTLGYSARLNNDLDSYSINAGIHHGNGLASRGRLSGYYNHDSPLADLSASFSAEQNGHTSFGVSASGGATMTAKGAALHGGGVNGGARLMVDTDGVANVPVDDGRVSTNRWGIGVVTDVNSYYRNTTSVDLNKLPDDIEATRSVVESVLTEGAIGYRKFSVLKGTRLFAVLRLADNSYPPFGASVVDGKGRELGMVGDNGLAWLSGVNPKERLKVSWDGDPQCIVSMPPTLNPQQSLLLPCQPIPFARQGSG